MDDRELLEMAAKAAGIDARKLPHAWPTRFDDDQWNPLIDDGDALRLAISCKLMVDTFDLGQCTVYSTFHGLPWLQDTDCKRAIVRAAAEIGRSMP